MRALVKSLFQYFAAPTLICSLIWAPYLHSQSRGSSNGVFKTEAATFEKAHNLVGTNTVIGTKEAVIGQTIMVVSQLLTHTGIIYPGLCQNMFKGPYIGLWANFLNGSWFIIQNIRLKRDVAAIEKKINDQLEKITSVNSEIKSKYMSSNLGAENRSTSDQNGEVDSTLNDKVDGKWKSSAIDSSKMVELIDLRITSEKLKIEQIRKKKEILKVAMIGQWVAVAGSITEAVLEKTYGGNNPEFLRCPQQDRGNKLTSLLNRFSDQIVNVVLGQMLMGVVMKFLFPQTTYLVNPSAWRHYVDNRSYLKRLLDELSIINKSIAQANKVITGTNAPTTNLCNDPTTFKAMGLMDQVRCLIGKPLVRIIKDGAIAAVNTTALIIANNNLIAHEKLFRTAEVGLLETKRIMQNRDGSGPIAPGDGRTPPETTTGGDNEFALFDPVKSPQIEPLGTCFRIEAGMLTEDPKCDCKTQNRCAQIPTEGIKDKFTLDLIKSVEKISRNEAAPNPYYGKDLDKMAATAQSNVNTMLASSDVSAALKAEGTSAVQIKSQWNKMANNWTKENRAIATSSSKGNGSSGPSSSIKNDSFSFPGFGQEKDSQENKGGIHLQNEVDVNTDNIDAGLRGEGVDLFHMISGRYQQINREMNQFERNQGKQDRSIKFYNAK